MEPHVTYASAEQENTHTHLHAQQDPQVHQVPTPSLSQAQSSSSSLSLDTGTATTSHTSHRRERTHGQGGCFSPFPQSLSPTNIVRRLSRRHKSASHCDLQSIATLDHSTILSEYPSNNLSRMSLTGAEGEFLRSSGYESLKSMSHRIDINNPGRLKNLDSLPKQQKHVWDYWAPSKMKPRSKINWLKSTLYPNSSRPFPWPLMLLNSLWTGLIVALIEIPGMHAQNIIDYLKTNSANISTFIGLTTFFLTIVIGFRVNQAYNRWWEARCLWGAMTNDSRDISLKALVHIDDHNLAVKVCLWTCISVDLLRNHLRGRRDLGLLNIMIDESAAISKEDVTLIENANHRVLMAYWQISKFISEAKRNGSIAPLMHLHMNEIVNKFNTYMGSMERILRCPMPIGYTCVIRLAIVCWMAILPFSLMPVFAWFSIPIDIIITYFVCGLEETAAELENPFGIDPNDLPLEHFTYTIRNNIFELLCTYEADKEEDFDIPKPKTKKDQHPAGAFEEQDYEHFKAI